MSIEGDMMRDSQDWQDDRKKLDKKISNRNRLQKIIKRKYPEIFEFLKEFYEEKHSW